MKDRLTVVDLFAGCGGLTEGLESTGRFRSVEAVEMDRDAAATYAENFGHHVFVGDIASWLAGDLPTADVVVGGPPCQGFSQLGRRDPADPRNLLWDAYVRAVERIQPKYFVIENVPRFFSSQQFEALVAEFRPGGRLADYTFTSATLNAADYGVAQNRRRAVLVAFPRGSRQLYFEESVKQRITVTQAWSMLSSAVHAVDLPEVPGSAGDVKGPYSLQDIHITRRPTELSLKRYQTIPVGGNRHDLPDNLKAACWLRHTTGASDVMGRLWADRPAVTMRTEFFKPEKGRFLHPTEHRPITHAEAARIQGFNGAFKWRGSKVSIARQIGNAVPPPLAAAIGRSIVDHHDA